MDSIVKRDSTFQRPNALYPHLFEHSTVETTKYSTELGLWTMQNLWEFGPIRLPYGPAGEGGFGSPHLGGARPRLVSADVVYEGPEGP